MLHDHPHPLLAIPLLSPIHFIPSLFSSKLCITGTYQGTSSYVQNRSTSASFTISYELASWLYSVQK